MGYRTSHVLFRKYICYFANVKKYCVNLCLTGLLKHESLPVLEGLFKNFDEYTWKSKTKVDNFVSSAQFI